MSILLTLFGGLLYRQRGGGIDIPIGTQGARAVWCIPTGVLCAIVFGNWWLLPAVAAVTFAGLMIPHGRFQDMSTVADDLLLDIAGMSAVCGLRAGLIMLAIFLLGHPFVPLLPFAGLLCGPAYAIAWRIPSTIPHLERGCALGEFFTGCLFWAAIVFHGELVT